MKQNKEQPKEIIQLAKRIKKLRKEKGYTNYEYFAYENNIPRSQYGRYEKGQDIRFSSLVKVVNAFNMSLKEFFSERFE